MQTAQPILIVEHDWQVADFVSKGLKGTWVAVGPSAIWQLDKTGIKYQISENFYDVNELKDTCEHYQNKLIKFCKVMDRQLAQTHPNLQAYNITPFLFSINSLSEIIIGSVKKIFEIDSILKKIPCKEIYAHAAGPQSWGEYIIGFSNQETLFGHLLSLNGWNVFFHPCPVKLNSTECPFRNSYFLKTLIKMNPRVLAAISLFRKGLTSPMLRTLLGKGRTILALNYGGYDWSPCLSALHKVGWRILALSSDQFFSYKAKKEEHDLLQFEEIDDDIKDLFQFKDISFWPLVADRITWLLRESSNFSKNIFERMNLLVKKEKIQILLTISAPDVISHTINQAAHVQNIPVVIWQHGMVMFNEDINELYQYSDMMTADTTLAYGPSSAEAYSTYAEDFNTDVLPVGSLLLAEYKQNISRLNTQARTRQRIVYITSTYHQNSWFYSPDTMISDNLFYRDQVTIITFLQRLAKNKNFEIIVKTRPSTHFMAPPWLKQLKNTTIQIVDESPTVKQLLEDGCAVVIDHPSTTVLEACCTKLPIFVLLNHFRHSPEAVGWLKKRAVCTHQAQELVSRLDDYLKNGEYPANLEDETFLNAYGVQSNCETITKKVLWAVENITMK